MNDILSYLTEDLTIKIKNMNVDLNNIQEIRMRVNKPIIILSNNIEYINKDVILKNEDINKTLEKMSKYSLYAYEEEIKNGYLSIQGGHRIGIVGKVIMEKGKIKTIRYISGLNIRISHQIKGCANKVMKYIRSDNKVNNTLVVSPPKCGKTTILRDIARQLSDGNESCRGFNIGIVDERSEIAGCYNGIAQNDIGIRTDVLDSCPKVEGMRMLLRSMSPEVIVVDEISGKGDYDAIDDILKAGVSLICSIHAAGMNDIKNNKSIMSMINQNTFECIIFLSNKNKIGKIEGIWNVREKRWEVYD